MPSTTTTTWETIPTNPDIVSKNPVRCANLILPRLYLSDLTTAKDVSIIESLGVTHMISVIDIVPTFPQSMANIQKLFVQSMDIMEDDLLQYMPMTTAFIKAALEENDLNVVLVHCQQGISRSATIVCAYLVATTNMIASETIDFVREKRPVVCPNAGFRVQLYEYSTSFYARGGKGPVKEHKVASGIAGLIERLKGSTKQTP